MKQQQREYVELQFKPYLIHSESITDYSYKITNSEPFELIKLYKHLQPYFISGVVKNIQISPSDNDKSEHVLTFELSNFWA